MAEKRLKLKTTKMGGKGGGIGSLRYKSGLFYFITFVLIFSLGFQSVVALASGRSSAGGGKIAKFDTGKWLAGTAIGMGSMAIGTALGNSMLGNGSLATNLSKLGEFSTWVKSYNVYMATNQVGRAVGAMGNYYGWNPKTTIFISSLATSMASGGINPSQFGNSVVFGIGNGVALGAINGAVEGAILSGLADKKGQLPIWAGPVAGLAGNVASGFVVGGLTAPKQVKTETSGCWGKIVTEKVVNPPFSFKNDFNLGSALQNGLVYSALPSIPQALVGIGVNSLTKDMEPQDAYIVRQAFSGVNPIVAAQTKNTLDNLGINGKHEFITPNNPGSNLPPSNRGAGGPSGVPIDITEKNFIKTNSVDGFLDAILKSRPDSNDLSLRVGEPNLHK